MISLRSIFGSLALVVGLATAVGVVLWMLRDSPPPSAPQPPPRFPVPVTVTKVVVGDVSERISLVGDVRAPERAQLAFERAGRIHELAIRLGDLVEAGFVLARLDDRLMEEQVKAREAALTQSREMAAFAQRDAERLKRIEGISASAAEIDRAEAGARNEAAKVAQMQADVSLERTRLEQGVLAAPYDAIVIKRGVSLGSYVAAGDPVCELLSLERREILLELPPQVAARVQSGTQVTLSSDELPDFKLAAPLHSVLPSNETRARTFTGVVRLETADDPERYLRPGMFVRASLELRTARGALTVPVDCLIEDLLGARIAVVVPGQPPTAGSVPIRVVARDERQAAIEPAGDAKLAAGAEVIVVGKENAAPGTPISLISNVAPPATKGAPVPAAGRAPAGGP